MTDAEGATSNMTPEEGRAWCAHAEALAGALRELLAWEQRRDTAFTLWAVAGIPLWNLARAALARLPADALREREALEGVAFTARIAFSDEGRVILADCPAVGAALKALDVARKGEA